MAKSKHEISVKDKLILAETWARNGLTDKYISKSFGISIKMFYE